MDNVQSMRHLEALGLEWYVFITPTPQGSEVHSEELSKKAGIVKIEYYEETVFSKYNRIDTQRNQHKDLRNFKLARVTALREESEHEVPSLNTNLFALSNS